MATVDEDLVNGHRANYYAAGADIIRTFRVSGLTANPWGQLDEALSDPGVPQLHDPYPTPPANNLRVQNREALPDGPNAARVIVFYTNKPGPTWDQAPPAGDGQEVKQVKASVTQKRTTRDATDTPMQLDPPPSDPDLPSYLSEAIIQAPVGSLVFERTESAQPSARMRQKVGRVNSDVLGGGNYQTGTLLFADLDAQSDDGGRTWRVVYEFRYDPDGWVHRDAWKLQNGKPPVDTVEVIFVVQGSTLFGDLGLDFSDSQSPI